MREERDGRFTPMGVKPHVAPWPYSQYSTALFACTPTFGEELYQTFNWLIKKPSLVSFQDNDLISAQITAEIWYYARPRHVTLFRVKTKEAGPLVSKQ